ncbi:MAG: hypothetical protein F7B19_05325 [Desulfurococcales archaeon]|nr:hypothetical protein [Desulfurococcales archaeon]MCE4626029.1 hypothetical protein [Desulfurococcales archaeon]
MGKIHWIIIIMIVLGAYAFTIAHSQPSEEQARQAFEQSGCYGCHTTHEWTDLTATITDWAHMYDSLDEAAQSVGYSSFDDLMTTMKDWAGLYGGISDQQYQTIYEYFVYLFNSSKPAQPTTTTTTTTQATGQETVTETLTITKEKTVTETQSVYVVLNESKVVERTVTESVPPAKPPSAFNYAAIVAAILALAGLGYLIYIIKK